MELKRLSSLIEGLDSGLCVAFSGGVDSAVLLSVACKASSNVHAVTMFTPFHSPREPEEAAGLAQKLGAVHHVIQIDELPDALLSNPTDRCYLCKKWIFTALWDYAKEHGLSCVLDGTNADDLGQYRPGLKALKELGVRSPLAELGLSKKQVREMALLLGLEVADKPSAPCLATRFPYDTIIPLEKLAVVDALENRVREMGFAVTRVRVHGNVARLEIPTADFEKLLLKREDVNRLVKEAGFDYATLDLEGFRSGSMDIHLNDHKHLLRSEQPV